MEIDHAKDFHAEILSVFSYSSTSSQWEAPTESEGSTIGGRLPLWDLTNGNCSPGGTDPDNARQPPTHLSAPMLPQNTFTNTNMEDTNTNTVTDTQM